MHLYCNTFLFMLLLGLFSGSKADESKRIIWAVNDAPPFYIVKGSNKGLGFGDRIQNLVIKLMPDHQHTVIQRPLKRVVLELKVAQPRCFSTWIYGSRKDISVTSAPYLHYQPQGLVVTKNTYLELGEPKSISLDTLLSNKEYIYGKPLGRGYGKPLSTIIEKHEATGRIREYTARSTGETFKLLHAGRIDYAIEYPFIMNYFELKMDLENQFHFIPLKENMSSILLGSIACTKSKWGRETIKDINIAIKKMRKSDDFNEILTDWFVNESNKLEYWNLHTDKVLIHND